MVKKPVQKKNAFSVWPSDVRSQKILLVLIASLCAITATMFAYALYTEWYVVDTVIVPIRVNVTEGAAIGFDLNDTVLSFGKVPQRGSGERVLKLYSGVSARGTFYLSGPISPWISLSVPSLDFSPGESRNVTVILSTPDNAPLGRAEGNLTIVYTRRFW